MQAVWFHLCYYFGRRGREGWCHMSKSTFMVRMDEDDAEYVCMNVTESTKNQQGSSKDYESNDVRMYRDGVKYFKQYISKLHPECQRLFQYGGRKSGSCWFDNKPVGKNAMAIIMQTINKSAGLSTVYTCHSVRASTITHL